MNESIAKLIAIAGKEVEIREGPVNNTSTRIVECQGATWLASGALHLPLG